MYFTFAIRLLNKLPEKTRGYVKVSLFGVVGGLAAVAFHLLMEGMFKVTYEELAQGSQNKFLIWSFIVIITTSLAVGYLLNNVCPDAKGSGVPQLKLSFWKDFGAIPFKVVWVKFLAGILSIGGGCSLGREGPSVQIAGGLASNLAGYMGEPKQRRRTAAAAGSAAGLAAAFNTPLAAMTFVLEEIVGDMNSRYIGNILLASLIGAFIVHGFLGDQPAFHLGDVAAHTWMVYLLIPIVAAAAGAVGGLFQKWTLKLRMRRKEFKKLPLWARPAIGGLITWCLGAAVFVYTGKLGVFGLGYHDLSAGLNANLGWKIAGILLVAKFLATFACYGFGGCGGIFSPTLFLGGMVGVFLAGVLDLQIDLNDADYVMLAVVGMSACLGAVVKAPITSILIVFELTHQFELVPALMLGTIVSQSVARRMNKHNFYEQIILQDGHELDHLVPPKNLRSWQQLPVSTITNFNPIILTSTKTEVLQEALENYPYIYFPVVLDGKFAGVISRMRAKTAIESGEKPSIQPTETCLPTETIRKLQGYLITSPTGIVIVTDRKDGSVIGLITLHDLLRQEVAHAENAE
ncbi:chloride channel protein [Verrucomicrobia bacterium]|nr:chloride channel protein [Verrucomicrobiota bacterium]